MNQTGLKRNTLHSAVVSRQYRKAKVRKMGRSKTEREEGLLIIHHPSTITSKDIAGQDLSSTVRLSNHCTQRTVVIY